MNRMTVTAKEPALTAASPSTARGDHDATSATPSSTPSPSRGSSARRGGRGAGKHRRRWLAWAVGGNVTYLHGEWVRHTGDPYDNDLVATPREPLPWTPNEIRILQDRFPDEMAKEYYSVPQRYMLGVDQSDTAAMALCDVETGMVSFVDTDVIADTRWTLTDKGAATVEPTYLPNILLAHPEYCICRP